MPLQVGERTHQNVCNVSVSSERNESNTKVSIGPHSYDSSSKVGSLTYVGTHSTEVVEQWCSSSEMLVRVLSGVVSR